MVEKKNTEGLFGKLLGGRKRAEHRSRQRHPDAAAEVPNATPSRADAGSAQDKAAAAALPATPFDVTAASATPTAAPQDTTPAQPVAPVTDSFSLVFKAPEIPDVPRERTDRSERSASGTNERSGRSSRHDNGRNESSRNESTSRRRQRNRSAERQSEEQHVALITEPQKVKGSTRLEAKRQRRSQGREVNRRRSSITETEFLARREAVDRQMIVQSLPDRIQIGVLEDDVLVEHYVAKAQDQSLIGSVYLGRVQNVLPSMEAAFVDIGRGRNAVLYSGEVDWDAADVGGKQRRIELALKAGDIVLVQVTKDPVGHKGARLTSQVSLPGRYLVYVPNGSMTGISRKLPESERSRLKKILKEIVPEGAGVIVRTAAEGATKEQLKKDIDRLQQQWESIQATQQSSQAPALLHAEPDLLIKIVRDVFNEDFTHLVISGKDALATIRQYLEQVSPDLLERVTEYTGDDEVFDHYRVNEQIQKALERKVWLPSGGTLVIDRTEAMTVIDVNTGKFVGSGGNLEETVTMNNLEAAEEIVRQLRLRDTGGIVVIDFIDMVLESNRDLVLRRLIECLGRDRTKHQVAEVTSLGLVQMTRKKLGIGLLEAFSEPCEVCGGRGVVVHHDPVFKKSTPEHHRKPRSGRQQKHKIDDSVKSGLAQVAASTIHKDEAEATAAAKTAGPSTPDKPRMKAKSSTGNRSASARDAASGSGATPVHDSPADTPTTAPAASAPAAPKRPRRAKKAAAAPTEHPELPVLDFTDLATLGRTPKSPASSELLDSVLAHLPEPHDAAPVKRRPRRATLKSEHQASDGED